MDRGSDEQLDEKSGGEPELTTELRKTAELNQAREVVSRAVDSLDPALRVQLGTERGPSDYPVLNAQSLQPEVAMQLLRQLASTGDYVYHGMHNNEFRRQAGMPDVELYDALDPSASHQDGPRKAVYATTSLEGGLTHALVEHRPEDVGEVSQQTYALKPSRSADGRTVEVSPQLAAAIERGEAPFTDGLLYILPKSQFQREVGSDGLLASDHEMVTRERVEPVAVVHVGAALGTQVVRPESVEVRP